MAAITSSDVTITLNARNRHILGKLRMSNGSMAFGDGTTTYASGGVSMPVIGVFGMNKEVSELIITDSSTGSSGTDGIIYKYDQANRKIRMFLKAPAIVHEEVVAVSTISASFVASSPDLVAITGIPSFSVISLANSLLESELLPDF